MKRATVGAVSQESQLGRGPTSARGSPMAASSRSHGVAVVSGGMDATRSQRQVPFDDPAPQQGSFVLRRLVWTAVPEAHPLPGQFTSFSALQRLLLSGG